MSVDVSVIIPSYNHAAFIQKAVASVLNQQGVQLELIVVDDGSTDDSLQVLASFKDARLQIVTQANQGAHAAINRGLAKASGEYLAILNSDDIYHPRRLEILMSVLKDDPEIGLVGSHIEVIDDQGQTLGIKHGYQDLSPWPLDKPERSFRAGNDLHAALLTENYYATTSNFMFRQSWFEQVGPFLPLRYTHDWDFALRMARAAKLALVPEPLLQYRVHDSNTIRENQAAMIFEICWILAVHLPRHLAAPWFREIPLRQRIDQLLHSMYTFNLDRVLNSMLLQRLAEDRGMAERLLEPDDAVRKTYLEYMEVCLFERNNQK